MLTVLGVVIGFVIAYRVGSGYDRYWMGRVCWSELIRNSRTMSRLIWFHVPPLVSQKTASEIASGKLDRSREEQLRVMEEKRHALDLIEGFAVATKHHLRGELGIYFEDLYHLVKPLHEHRPKQHKKSHAPRPASATSAKATTPIPSTQTPAESASSSGETYGTFTEPSHQTLLGSLTSRLHLRRSHSGISSHSTESIQQQPLLPSTNATEQTFMSSVSTDLIPFAGLLSSLRNDFWKKLTGGRPLEVLQPNLLAEQYDEESGGVHRKWAHAIEKRVVKHGSGHPRVAGDGQNLPLAILQCLSNWSAILEDRNTVPGNSMAGILSCIAALEDNLSAMERILTTPLPFVYSVHIRHTVWLYLFFLPIQLAKDFGWHSILGVAVAAFIYLGFLAAGEEIEQPFGYEDNDLDLDLFCHEIVHTDMERLKGVRCFNAYFPHPERNHLNQPGGEETDDTSVFGTLL